MFCEQGAFNLEYFPLKAGSSQGKLELTSNDLGLYVYDVELKAVPPAPEKALNFQTCLGSSQTLSAKFVSYAKHKTDYTCKVREAQNVSTRVSFLDFTNGLNASMTFYQRKLVKRRLEC